MVLLLTPWRWNFRKQYILKAIYFNINGVIWAKLTPEGWTHWLKDFNKYTVENEWIKMRGLKIWAKKYHGKKDGWVRFQMWNFMSIFGPKTGMGFPNLFETGIKIEIDENNKFPISWEWRKSYKKLE